VECPYVNGNLKKETYVKGYQQGFRFVASFGLGGTRKFDAS